MSSAPPPLTPARSDLRDFGFMPLEIVRFRGSDLLSEDAEVVLAALMLWTAAWHETPAASLSDDDKVLARAAGYGRAVIAWLEVKDRALRGFVKCSDGRLYHPVVARLANDAWRGKVEQRHRTELARRRKHNERHPDNQLALPSFEAFAAHFPDDCPEDKAALSQGQLGLVAATQGQCSQENGSKGQGEGQGQGESYKTTPPKPPAPAKPVDVDKAQDLMSLTDKITAAAGVSIMQPRRLTAAMDTVKKWVEAGIEVEGVILPTIARRLADMPEGETVGSLVYFDAAIRKAQALKDGPKPKRREGGPILKAQDEGDVAKLRDRLRQRLGAGTYDSWIKPGAVAIVRNGASISILTDSRFKADWIAGNLSDAIRAEVLAVTGIEDVRIEVQA